jgi:hypothetical protein
VLDETVSSPGYARGYTPPRLRRRAHSKLLQKLRTSANVHTLVQRSQASAGSKNCRQGYRILLSQLDGESPTADCMSKSSEITPMDVTTDYS